MKKTKAILDHLDPEVIQRMNGTRREALHLVGKIGLGLAAATIPAALAVNAKKAFAQGLPQGIIDVLNFALTLEYLESEFYQTGIDTQGLIPDSDRAIFDQIRLHENAHVALLESVLGDQAVDKPQFDFTAGGAFMPFQDYGQFKILAQGFEDTGVRAYKGQVTNVMSNDMILETAARIHSVEARHAAEVRRLNGAPAWIEGDMTQFAPLQAVYEGEDSTTVAGLDVTTVTNVDGIEVTEAFDEPLTVEEVLAIAGPFIAG